MTHRQFRVMKVPAAGETEKKTILSVEQVLANYGPGPIFVPLRLLIRPVKVEIILINLSDVLVCLRSCPYCYDDDILENYITLSAFK